MAGAGGAKNPTPSKRHQSKHQQQQQQPPQTAFSRRQNLLQLVAVAASATAAAHSFLTSNDLTLHPSQTLTLESNISAVSLSISNLLSLIHHPIAFAIPRPPPPPPSWFHRFLNSVNNSSSDHDQLFIESFRMSKQSFSYLLSLLNPSLTDLTIPANYAVASALFRLAHSASFNAVARRFDIDSQMACRVFYTVCKAIIDNLGHLFELRSDLNRIEVGFRWNSLPNCCGALGIDNFPVKGNLFGDQGT